MKKEKFLTWGKAAVAVGITSLFYKNDLVEQSKQKIDKRKEINQETEYK